MTRQTYTTDQIEAHYGRSYKDAEAAGDAPRVALTAAEHILYLLLTVFTGGLFLPVWIYLSLRGQKQTT